MHKYVKSIAAMTVLLLAGCSSSSDVARQRIHHTRSAFFSAPSQKKAPTQVQTNWSMITKNAARHNGVDQKLIEAIIAVESGGNPGAVSKSNAVGLMQIKASTAGRAVYQAQGRQGQPSQYDLRNPVKNIAIGTAYLRILQRQELAGIRNPKTLHYATIVAYANGAGALLRTFSSNRQRAIAMINAMTPEAFYRHVQKKHPAAQAPRYLNKVTAAYQAINGSNSDDLS